MRSRQARYFCSLDRLLREIVDVLSLEALKARLDGTQGSLNWQVITLSTTAGLELKDYEGLFQLESLYDLVK